MTVLLRLRWTCTALITIVIFVLSTMPIPEVPELEDVPFIDKWVHFVMYGALSVAIWIDRTIVCRKRMTLALWTFLFAYPAVYGGLMELVQAYFTTCRSGDWLDFYADTFGALLGLVICVLINKPITKIL